MKRQFISELTEGERVSGVFAIRAKEMRSARTGEAYLTMDLADRTGRIGAVMFRPGREAAGIPAGTVAHITGAVSKYRNTLRVTVQAVRPARDYEPSEILPSSTRDTEELLAELRTVVGSIHDRALGAVVRKVFSNAGFMKSFKRCPASQGYHHAYIGGLLEHTVAVARICRGLAGLYPHLDLDLLLAGALLHDIGKVDELDYSTSIDFTDDGRMIGHVLLGERRVRDAVVVLGDKVPHDVATRLSHVLLAHHGELEWGSPKRPCTLEALVLHHADNLDAKTAGFIEASASAGLVDEAWTDAANLFRRPLWAPRPAEDDRVRRPSEDQDYAISA